VRFGVSAVVALVVAAGVACDNTTAGGDLHGIPITLGDNYFAPTSVTVNPGDTVVWIWNGSLHNVAFDATVPGAPSYCGQFSVGECRRVFTMPGTYPFTCTLHAGMDGAVTVRTVP
jgi:plastocyanin